MSELPTNKEVNDFLDIIYEENEEREILDTLGVMELWDFQVKEIDKLCCNCCKYISVCWAENYGGQQICVYYQNIRGVK